MNPLVERPIPLRDFPWPLAIILATAGALRAGDMTILTREHADVQVVDRPGSDPRLGLVVRNGDNGMTLEPASTLLEIGEAGRLEVPQGLGVFGPPGSSIWILPQSQDPALLYLGISASGIAPGTWDGRFNVELLKVDGPGHFFVWQYDAFSGLEMRMNSRDGIGPEDSMTPLLGSHEHVNWGFTATGLHEVQLRVSGRLQGTTNVVRSDPVSLWFGVVPYALPARSPVLSRPAWDGSQLTCLLQGSALRTYPLESSSDLLTWTSSGTVTTDASGLANVAVPSPTHFRFLRARTTP